MLRSFFVAVGTLLITICACGEVEWKGPLSSRSQRQWESPDKTVVFSISKNPKDSSLEDMFLKRGGEKPIEVKGVESELEQESMGNGWFPDAKYKWIGNRFLVFDSGDGIGVLDIKNERFLINNAFESYIKHPTEDKWMFVRFRGMWRGHGWKPESFTDTIGLIEPTVEALKPEKTSSLSETEGFAHATFFDHVRWITLDGLMVSPPMWSKNGAEIVFLQWNNGKTYLCLHDGKTLKENKRTEVQINVPRKILDSPKLENDLQSQLESLIK